MEPVDVIYIMSSGHSGSTLLDLMLGSHSRIEGIGEIRSFETYFAPDTKRPVERQDCTCGKLARECPYWTQVRDRIAARLGTRDIKLDPDADPTRFEEENHALFEAILEVSGKRMICDSSKHFRRLRPLLRSKLFRVHVVHLLRDGRAVANSGRRNWSIRRTALTWQTNLYRALLFAFRRRGSFTLTRIRYEDLALRPEATLRQIIEKHGLEFEPSQLDFSSREHHNLSGNRMRMKKGQRIELDTKYLDQLSASDWITFTCLSAPTLLYFGYPLRRSKTAARLTALPQSRAS